MTATIDEHLDFLPNDIDPPCASASAFGAASIAGVDAGIRLAFPLAAHIT
jgi:hypothetical protein